MKATFKIIISLLALLLISVTYKVVQSPLTTDGATIYFFDVGQGDAALIQKDHFQILIDGGPNDKVLAELGRVMPLGDRSIEKIILTHPHADHITGLNLVLDRYEVSEVISSGVISSSNQYIEFLNKIKDKDIPLIIPSIGEKDQLFDNGTMEYLWPGDEYMQKEISNLNNSSVVSRFCYFENCTLFAGDIETDAQSEMFAKNSDRLPDFAAKIIKISHHGSKNGSNNALFDNVKPGAAVISAGKDNQFGHPHTVTLDLLKSFNITTLRTDQNSTIEFRLSESQIEKR